MFYKLVVVKVIKGDLYNNIVHPLSYPHRENMLQQQYKRIFSIDIPGRQTI